MRKFWGKIADYIRETDKLLFSLCVFSSLYGCVLVLSTTRYTGSARQFFVQLSAMLLGVTAAVVVSSFDYEAIMKIWPILAGIAVLLVALTFFIGYAPEGTDDKAWLHLPGGMSLQPSELLKIAFIITFAKHVSLAEHKITRPLHVLLLCAHGAFPVLLIHLQGDDGTALVLAIIFVAMMLAAGVQLRYFLIAAGAAAVLSPVMWFAVLSEEQRGRILLLFHPEDDLLGGGWQQWRARIALANGGLFGRGLFRGENVQNELLPESYNDFIFASAGEELGLLGLIVIMLLLAAVCIRILRVAHLAKDKAGVILCTGVFAMLAAQSILNIGMCVSILPVIGITLPFFSAGGSSLICLYLGIGLVLSVFMHRSQRIVYLHESY